MTTVEIFQRLLKESAATDLSLLDASDALDLVDSLNGGMQKFFEEAPTAYKRTTISERLAVPRTISLGVTQGSAQVSGTPFLATERGCSIVIDGEDIIRNEIVDTNQLLHDITGSTGSRSATIYHDAIPFTDFSIERMISDPVWIDPRRGANAQRRLIPDTQYATDTNNREAWYLNFGRDSTGSPQWYHVLYGGMVQGSDIIWALRIYPMPSFALTVKMDVELRPLRYKLASLQTPAVLPLPDGLVEQILLPICLGEMARKTLFSGNTSRRDMLIGDGNRAITAAGKVQRSINRPRRKVRTAYGY